MKNCRYCQMFLLLGLISFSSLTINRAFSIGPEEAERFFRSRVPNDIGLFSKRIQSSALTLEGVNEYLSRGETETILFKKRNKFYLLKSEYRGKNADAASDICNGINSKYCFELVKNKSGMSWTVARLVFITSDPDEFNVRKQGFRLSGSQGGFRSIVDDSVSELTKVYLYGGHRVSMEKLFELPKFELRSIAMDGTTDNIIRADFNYELIDPKTHKSCLTNCILDFDLKMHCLPIKVHQSCKMVSKEVVFDWQRDWLKTDDDNYSFKLIIKTKTTSDSEPERSSEFISNMKVILRDLPEKDFTLSAFGLLEPPGIEWKKPFPWYLIIACIGTACVGVFLFLRTRSKRLRI